MIDLTKNGDITLTATEAYTETELNGAWSATIIHPIDDLGRWEYLTETAVVKMNSWNGPQLYRIIQRVKTDTEVMCTLYPIFYDAADDCYLLDVRPTDVNGQAALNMILTPNEKYSGSSNISKIASAYYEDKNALEAIAGGDNSFLERWGGEIEFDNYHVKINTRLGSDNNLELRYGKNISEISEDVDMSNVITRIYPKAFNGRRKSGTPYVDSENINAYPTVKAACVTFDHIKTSGDASEDDYHDPSVIICKNQSQLNKALVNAAKEYFNSGADKPVVSVTVYGVADLAKLPEYAGFNQPVNLGDTVHLIHNKLNIKTDARINYIKYNCLLDQVEDIGIGQVSYNFFRDSYSATNKINAVVRDDLTVKAESVAGVMNMKEASLYAQYDAATKSDVVGILFENNDPTSELYGAMAIGTQGFMIADKKDINGNWVFSTIGTAKGFVASAIISGILSSKDGSSYWDLDNSKLVFGDNQFDSQVVLDEGFIQFLHSNQQFGKILRALLDGTNILQIIADNGLDVQSGGTVSIRTTGSNFLIASGTTTGNNSLIASGTNRISGDTDIIIGNKIYLSTPENSGDPEIYVGNTSETRKGYSGSILVDGKTIYVHSGLITSVV